MKPLINLTDEELIKGLEQQSTHVLYGANDYLREIDRREKNARAAIAKAKGEA